MNTKAIELKNVSKTFMFRESSQSTIRGRVLNIFSSKTSTRKIYSLDNINLEINKGEFVGIIGHNGSGKSTLLRLIIGAYKADKGSLIKTQGRIIRLALGLGFDMNLSARDNIYVNGSILGISFKRIGQIFDQIIDFAELHDFIDTPVKFYSSGMKSRLSFSIAMHAEADILLIDEFFGGVGDERFRKKSDKAFDGFVRADKTILFVTHSLKLIKHRADRVLYLKNGKIIAFGPPAETIKKYLADMAD